MDMSRSTDDRLYCYEYMADEYSSFGNIASQIGFSEITDHVTLCIQEFSQPIESFINEDGYENYLTADREIPVPVKDKAATAFFSDGNGQMLEISAISMKTSCTNVYPSNADLSEEEQLYDEDIMEEEFLYHLSIKYKDGSEYLVLDENTPYDTERCKVETANYQYIVGCIDGGYILLFNRLVDTDNIESITVNDDVYSVR